MIAFPTCTQPSYLGPSSDLASVSFASSAQNTGTSGRKQACVYCRQRKRKCDAKIPNCSTCMKNRVRCSYILPTAPSDAGENQVEAPWHGNTPASDPEHFPIVSSAGTLSGLFPMNPEAAFWNPSTTMASDAGFIQNFLPQHSVLPSSNLQNEASLQLSQLLQFPPSTPNYTEGIQTAFQMQENPHPGKPASDAVNSLFGRSSLGRNVSLGTQLREDSKFNLLPETLSFNDENMASTQLRARHSSNTSNSLESRSPSSELDRTLETCTASLQKTAGLTESEELLPSVLHILELLDIFFNYYHNYLPCIHRKTLTERVKSRLESAQSSPLLWAVLAVAAPAHPNPHLQALQSRWLAKARSTFDTTLNSSTFPTQSLQAAVFIIFQAYISADLTDAWFFLGKSCRLANLLGIDRVDCPRSERLISLAPRPRDAIEIEEQRKTIWALFFLDRSLSCLAGFALAIDDRNYQVNFPLEDEFFQNATCDEYLSEIAGEPFTTDITALLSPAVLQSLTSRPSMVHIFRASVLLGQIMVLHNHLHLSRNSKEYRAEVAKLENGMSLFCFALSRGSTHGRETTSKELQLYSWLNTLVQICKILLHHPTTAENPSTLLQSPEDAGDKSGFPYCLDAMRHILDTLRNLAKRSSDAISNPFLVTAYFLCCRFLSISWHEHRNQSDREDIDFVLMLMDRAGEKWPPLAKKFRKGIMRDLAKNPEEARRMRVGTGSYLDVECS